MGQWIDKFKFQNTFMSQNSTSCSSILTRHIKKKVKKDDEYSQTQVPRNSCRQINLSPLEPRRDLPLHKIPELLAKITGTSSINDRCESLFEYYSNGRSELAVNGILEYCHDHSIQPDSYELLQFCFLCRAKQMYSLTHDEFLLGLKTLINHVDDLNRIRILLLNYDILPYETEFYLWTYQYGLNDGQRCLTIQNAIGLWRLFYSKNIKKPQIFDDWISYLETNEVPETITCDTWAIFPRFAKFIETNGYEAYDDNEAWPYLFDAFVEYRRKMPV